MGKRVCSAFKQLPGRGDRRAGSGGLRAPTSQRSRRHSKRIVTEGENNRKNGNEYLAWAYVEAANFAIRRYHDPIKGFYQRKKAKTKTNWTRSGYQWSFGARQVPGAGRANAYSAAAMALSLMG